MILRRRPTIVGLIVSAIGAIVWLVFFHPRGLSRERQWLAQPDAVGPMLYTPDGKTLVTGGKDPVRLWDPATETLKATLSTYEASVSCVAVSRGGDLLACSRGRRIDKHTESHTLELWDLKTGKRLASVDAPVSMIVFAPNGSTLVTESPDPPFDGTSCTLQTWSVPALAPVSTFKRPGVISLAFSNDGRVLASGEGYVIELLDVKTGVSTRTLTGPASGFLGPIHFSPDDQTLCAISTAYPSSDGALWTWNLSSGQAKQLADFEHPAHSASFSADGKKVAVLLTWYMFGRSDRAEVWDTVTGRKIGSLRVSDLWMWSVALAPDGQHLAVGFQPGGKSDATIGIWRVR